MMTWNHFSAVFWPSKSYSSAPNDARDQPNSAPHTMPLYARAAAAAAASAAPLVAASAVGATGCISKGVHHVSTEQKHGAVPYPLDTNPRSTASPPWTLAAPGLDPRSAECRQYARRQSRSTEHGVLRRVVASLAGGRVSFWVGVAHQLMSTR